MSCDQNFQPVAFAKASTPDAMGRGTASTWVTKYYVQGKPVRESTGTDDRAEAVRMLRHRMAKADRYTNYSKEIGRVLMDQLFDLLLEDYRFNRRATT